MAKSRNKLNVHNSGYFAQLHTVFSKKYSVHLTRKWFTNADSLRCALFGRWLCVVVHHIARGFVVATRWETVGCQV